VNLILYGPPGAGKTSVGRELARRLGREFVDADAVIAARAGRTIPALFAERGEAGFRQLEAEVCAELAARDGLVIAPGGGAFLDPANRAALERAGLVICLRADAATLLARLTAEGGRPLLADDPAAKLGALLESRRSLYDSCPVQIETAGRTVAQVADAIEAQLVTRTLSVDAPGLQHEVVLGYGLLSQIPRLLEERRLTGPALLVTDENVVGQIPGLGSQYPALVLPPGESNKTLDTIRRIYDACLEHGLDRNALLVAVGGGVIGDMAGFAAATFMRGVRWVNVPTTLLAMVDASLGGKTGVDLPQGKNLVGAFHPPALVVSDPLVLNTLPAAERASGLAEVIKHAVIGDPALFEWLEGPLAFGSLDQLERAIRVKARVVEADPFERGRRATLNLGHTIGHGVEAASGYALRHGEAVAVGLAAEAEMAERLGLAEPGLAGRMARVLARRGLPVRAPGLNPVAVRAAMGSDKKRAGGRLKFALPRRLGDVVWGVEVDEALLMETLRTLTAGYR